MIPRPFGRKDEIFGRKDLRYTVELRQAKEVKDKAEAEREQEKADMRTVKQAVVWNLGDEKLTTEQIAAAENHETIVITAGVRENFVANLDTYQTISETGYVGEFTQVYGTYKFFKTEGNVETITTYYYTISVPVKVCTADASQKYLLDTINDSNVVVSKTDGQE